MKTLYIIYIINIMLLICCEKNPIDVKCYYKEPEIHIENDNVYNWTDVMIKLKIKGNLFKQVGNF